MPKNPFNEVGKALSPPKPKAKPKAKAATAKKSEPRKATMYLKTQVATRNATRKK